MTVINDMKWPFPRLRLAYIWKDKVEPAVRGSSRGYSIKWKKINLILKGSIHNSCQMLAAFSRATFVNVVIYSTQDV